MDRTERKQIKKMFRLILLGLITFFYMCILTILLIIYWIVLTIPITVVWLFSRKSFKFYYLPARKLRDYIYQFGEIEFLVLHKKKKDKSVWDYLL